MKNNPYLLQESEVENADTDLSKYASKIRKYNNNMDISMEEDQDNV